ncbi:MAG: helix-turn-helix domain-containing protein [Bacteroidales bacterium]|nr:helix-turn-helix domain-containing protein [Bacteroidales bacterium]
MLALFIWFLPASACLFCLLQNIISVRRTATAVTIRILLLVCFIYFLAASFHAAPETNLQTLGIARLVELVSAPCIIPLALMCLYKLKYNEPFASRHFLWLVIPVFFLSIGFLLHELTGKAAVADFLSSFYLHGHKAADLENDAVHLYYIFTVIAFWGILILEAAVALGLIVWHLLKHKNPEPVEDKGQENEEQVFQQVEKTGAPAPMSSSAEQLFATLAGTWDEENLLARFQKLLVKDKLFLQPGLSIVEIAEKLHSNKTYVSKLVNSTYHMGFPELLNALRIDYAEHYIINHPGAKQNEIAEACGFLNASAFNSIFKKMKGVTPRAWAYGINNKVI